MSEFVITCPECATRYKTSEASFRGDGRTVRCAKCETTWFVRAPDVIDALVADPDALAHADNMNVAGNGAVATAAPSDISAIDSDVDAALSEEEMPGRETKLGADVMMRNRVDYEKLSKRRRTIRIIWAIPLILVTLAAIIAYFNRQAIVKSVPSMATVYHAFGIEVRADGLEIDPPEARTVLVDGKPVIRIESVVRNLTRKPQPVPLIELTLHDRDGEGLVQWYVEAGSSIIEGRGRIVFTTEITDPPEGSVGLRYKFADETELADANG